MVCVQEFHSRFSSLTGPRSKRWYDEEDSISFRTTENADAALLAISGTQTTRLPQVGTDIDIRGRTFFYGTLHTNPNHKKITFHRNAKAAAAPELAIVVDLSEFYVTKLKKGDPNRCTVLCAVPLRTVIASATEGASLHVAIRRQEKPSILQDEIIKDGKLTLCFESSGISLIVKETLEKYCSAYRFKIATDIDDMLEKCCEMAGNLSPETSESSSTIVEEEWDDFQQA